MATIQFANTDEEAKEKFKQYSSPDPFPEIPPALLNSADVFDYVGTTGMVFPFNQTPEKLKPASYEVPFLGLVIYWNEGMRSEEEIKDGTKFKLRKNSIAFVWPKTVFRLPDYIALRFNLQITHVHRGLLLGTGPLIDPGFAGRILIPLHNLTSEDYELVGGTGLIWVEFTKLSPNRRWNAQSNRSSEHCYSFPFRKVEKEPHYYFEKASRNQPIQSSIPGEVKTAKDDAEKAKDSAVEAKETVKRMRRWVYWGGGVAAVAVVVGIASAVIAVFTLISNTNTRLDSIMSRLSTLEAKSDTKSSAGATPHILKNAGSQSGPVNDATKDRVHQDKKSK